MNDKKANIKLNLENVNLKIKKLELQRELYEISLLAIEKKENKVTNETTETEI
jgi:hypothetical protein